jgi:hypothetical protein
VYYFYTKRRLGRLLDALNARRASGLHFLVFSIKKAQSRPPHA